MRASLAETGSLFQSSSDTEIIVHLVVRSHQDTVIDRLIDAIKQIEGAFSLVCIAKDMLIVCVIRMVSARWCLANRVMRMC